MLIAIELALQVILVAFITMQVIVPLVLGRPLFPMFRRRKLDKAVRETRAALDDVETMTELTALQKEVEAREQHLRSREQNDPTKPAA